MAAKPCTAARCRAWIQEVFAEPLSGTVNDRGGDCSTARPRQVEDLPACECLAHNVQGDAMGGDLPGRRGSDWDAYQALREFLSHGGRLQQGPHRGGPATARDGLLRPGCPDEDPRPFAGPCGDAGLNTGARGGRPETQRRGTRAQTRFGGIRSARQNSARSEPDQSTGCLQTPGRGVPCR